MYDSGLYCRSVEKRLHTIPSRPTAVGRASVLKIIIIKNYNNNYALTEEDEDDSKWRYGGPFRFETA